ncbi:ribonuclease [Serratia phage 4S]|nr:ribonuclease [Serratia phage 4S]
MTGLNDLSELMGEESPKGVCLFDMSQLALATALVNFEDKQPINTNMIRHLVMNTVKFNVKKFRAQYPNVVLAFDNAEGGYWRRDYGYYYKKNRGKAREESTWDFEGYFAGMKAIVEEFPKYMPYTSLNIPRVEADDIIGVLVIMLTLAGIPVMIVSSDGDYTQLHGFGDVKQWAPQLKKFVKAKSGSARIDLFTKLLKGDKKDNVASVRCRSDFWYTLEEGERTPAMKTSVIEACAEASSDDEIKEILEKAYPDDKNIFERYQENLIMISMTHIPDDIVALIKDSYNNYRPAPKSRMYSYFVKNALSNHMKNINEF